MRIAWMGQYGSGSDLVRSSESKSIANVTANVILHTASEWHLVNLALLTGFW